MTGPILITLVVAALVVVVLLCFVVFGIVVNHYAFGRRHDRNKYLRYYTAHEYKLDAEPIYVPSGRILLHGYVYSYEKDLHPDKVIVFCHGLGPGHCAYMTEIAYFCYRGYRVVATDYRGCGETPGRNARGFYSGVVATQKTVEFVKKMDKFAGRQVILLGHSWGGYAAICAQAVTDVDAVVAISAPDSPTRVLANSAGRKIPHSFAYAMIPVWVCINFFLFGPRGSTKCRKAAKEKNTPMLLIQGDLDRTVPMELSAYKAISEDRATKILAEGKYHNPYNTENAEVKLRQLNEAVGRMSIREENEKKDYFAKFNFRATVEEDPVIMQKIADYIAAVHVPTAAETAAAAKAAAAKAAAAETPAAPPEAPAATPVVPENDTASDNSNE